MNFLQIVQRVHRESGRSTPAPTDVATTDVRQMRVIEAVKDAWREVQSERADWKWMRQTLDAPLTVDQQMYTSADFPTFRFGRWRRETEQYWPIVYISGSPNAQWDLTYRQLDNFRQHWIYRVMGGTLPLDWSIDEQQRLLIGPKPGVAYMLRKDYWTEPWELGTANADDPGSDVPDLPERFHNLLVWRALIDVATFDAKPEILALANRKHTDMHGKLVLDQALELPYV